LLFGYRTDQIKKLKLVNPVKKSFRVRRVRPWLQNYRPISRRLPVYYPSATPPRPCPGQIASTLSGVAKRAATSTPKPDRKLRREFSRFVSLWLKRNFEPLTTDEMMNFDEWLESTSYSEARKTELRKVWEDCGANPSKRMLVLVKCFVKDETYPEYKFPRGIYSRSDAAKCLFGPLVQSVSKKLFSMHWFIKKIPVVDRPMVIYEKLYKPGSKYVYTDYTAFEAHFTSELMEDCENKLYKWATRKLSRDTQKVAATMADVKSGKNKMTLRHLTANKKREECLGKWTHPPATDLPI
jgi:hypothetical protein